MSHVDSELSTRFARSCTAAAFGYARAASAAYAAFAGQTFDFWARAASGQAPVAPSHPAAPYLVTGPRPYRSAMQAEATPPTPMDFMGVSNAWASAPMFAPVRAWWGLFPLEGNPASWPMAYAMMTAGVPRAVALPAAEANVAAMDAADAASASIDRVFGTYRSDNGFAATHVIESSKQIMRALFLAPMAPLTMNTNVRLPW